MLTCALFDEIENYIFLGKYSISGRFVTLFYESISIRVS